MSENKLGLLLLTDALYCSYSVSFSASNYNTFTEVDGWCGELENKAI